ncbi:MAG: AAA family ATPase [Microbacterium sp.]|uniref:replicative DNA helicase n=1 Tax=Microbacterium sp. TaxID=51671 RepID=UPI0026276636|nr:DnaB-like helicase C-terminal domain-containing protein [Microbacterium sp.]MCV0420093.1 AAA family ATPase [Microbacterium sp.]
MNERPLYSEEAEQGVIGALIINPLLCEDIGAVLSASHFADLDLACLYGLVLQCHSKKIKPDVITIAEQAERLPSGESTIYVAGLIQQNMSSSANGMTYARIVKERHHARQLHEVGQAIMELSGTRGRISDQIAQARQLLMDLCYEEEEPDVTTYAESLGSVFDKMEERLEGKKEMGLTFGLEDLDDVVQGLRPGNLVIIAGKPGTGKTVMGTNLCDKIAMRNDKSALIFSLEMSRDELTLRGLAAASGVSKDLLESGKAIENPRSESALAAQAAVSRMVKADVRICDKPALSFSRICNIARFEHRAKPLDLIVIDYLTLITSDPGSKFQTRSAEIGSFTRGFKALAKELGIPIIVLAQFNRAMDGRGQNARPQMSDLRDSGEIEQDADVIMLAYRDNKSGHGEKGITEWDIPKCRHAAPGFCLLQFQGAQQRFVSSALSFEQYQEKGNDQSGKEESRGRYAR